MTRVISKMRTRSVPLAWLFLVSAAVGAALETNALQSCQRGAPTHLNSAENLYLQLGNTPLTRRGSIACAMSPSIGQQFRSLSMTALLLLPRMSPVMSREPFLKGMEKSCYLRLTGTSAPPWPYLPRRRFWKNSL